MLVVFSSRKFCHYTWCFSSLEWCAHLSCAQAFEAALLGFLCAAKPSMPATSLPSHFVISLHEHNMHANGIFDAAIVLLSAQLHVCSSREKASAACGYKDITFMWIPYGRQGTYRMNTLWCRINALHKLKQNKFSTMLQRLRLGAGTASVKWRKRTKSSNWNGPQANKMHTVNKYFQPTKRHYQFDINVTGWAHSCVYAYNDFVYFVFARNEVC